MEWIEAKVASPYGAVTTLHWAAEEKGSKDNDQLTMELETAQDELGSVLWNSNTAALNYLHAERMKELGLGVAGGGEQQQNEQFLWRNEVVIELGAGVGCLGVALAFSGAESYVTDLKELVPLMKKNISINESRLLLRQKGCSYSKTDKAFTCTATALRWGDKSFDPTLLEAIQRKDKTGVTIVMCDALYGNAKHWPMLLADLKRISAMCGPNVVPKVYNFCEQRVEGVTHHEKEFVDMLRKSEEWEVDEALLEERSELQLKIRMTRFWMRDDAIKIAVMASTAGDATTGATNKKEKNNSSSKRQSKEEHGRQKRGRD